jgi:hypothetical protein
MGPARIDDPTPQSDLREPERDEVRQSQLTPARRAALDALEREFHELLQAPAR